MFTPPDKQLDENSMLENNTNLFNSAESTGNEFSSVSDYDNSEESNFTGDDVPGTDVHTMPSKFLQPSKTSRKKKGRISWIILSIVIFIVLGAVIVVAVIFLSGEKGTTTEPVTPIINQNVNIAPPAEPIEDINSNVNEMSETPKNRDAQRLMDVFDIRSALNMYFAERGVYPSALSTLLRDYLSIVPSNPTPGGEDYSYSVTSDKLDFSLTFALEEGGNLGNLVLEANKYKLTSAGISIFLAGEVEPTNPDLPALPAEPNEPVVPALGQDTDGDKLSDIEENLYHTNSTLIDSDGDGYNDLDELLGLFDPTKGDGARLFESGLVDVYQNSNYNYSLLYPASWTARALTSENKEIIFNSDISEFIEIIVQSNPLGLSAYNWYLSQNPTVNTGNLTTLLIDNLPAVQSPDGLTTYLGVGSNIYIITYNVGTTQQMNFYSTYQFFLKTFMFITPEVPEAPEVPEEPVMTE